MAGALESLVVAELTFRVSGFVFRGFGFRVSGFVFRVLSSGVQVPAFGWGGESPALAGALASLVIDVAQFQVSELCTTGTGPRTWCSVVQSSRFGFRHSGFGFRVSGRVGRHRRWPVRLRALLLMSRRSCCLSTVVSPCRKVYVSRLAAN